MLIERITVRDFGVLRGPLDVKLHPGLNVIYGPNESGKSTLMRALWMALTTKARTTGQALTAIRPTDGAVPEVSLAFSHRGCKYRVHKRFAGSRGLSQLTVHDSQGHVEDLNGEAAELRLRVLLGLDSAGQSTSGKQSLGIWPLIWIRQGHSGLPPTRDLEAEGYQTLATQLRSIQSDLLAGSDTDLIRKAVEEEYAKFFTATGQASRKGGAPLHEAMQRAARAQAEYVRLRDQNTALEQNAERIAALQNSLQQLDSEFATLQGAIQDQQTQIAAIKPLEEQLKAAQLRLETERLRDKHVTELLVARRHMGTRLDQLKAQLAAQTAAFERLQTPSAEYFATMQLTALKDITVEINGKSHRIASDASITEALEGQVALRIGDVAQLQISPAPRDIQSRKQLEEQLTQLRAEIDASELRLSTHLETHGNDADLASAVAQAQAQIQAATQAVQDLLPLQERIAGLQAQLRTSQARLESLRSQRARVSEQLHELRGRLAGLNMLGLHERLEDAAVLLQHADNEVSRLSTHAAAVQLLHDTLEETRRECEGQVIEPVEREVLPLLQTIFPKGVVSLQTNLEISGLHRPNQGNHAFDALSAGTKEQVGLAIRLGTAKALARSESLPVILDDALVATDEQRLHAMAVMLEQVCDQLQVLLLTCHWSRYQDLPLPRAHVIDLQRASAYQP